MAKVTRALAEQIVSEIGDELRLNPGKFEGLQLCERLSRQGLEITIAQTERLWKLIDDVLANTLTDEQDEALAAYAAQHGRSWKQALNDDWMNGRVDGELYRLRNKSYFGPSGLILYKLPK